MFPKTYPKNVPKNYSSSVWGSLSWVATGAAVLGLMESAVSSKMEKEGADIIVEAIKLAAEVRDNGKFFRTTEIENIVYPLPQLWSAYDLTECQTDLIHYRHDLEPFTCIKNDRDEEVIIVWDKVEQLRSIWE